MGCINKIRSFLFLLIFLLAACSPPRATLPGLTPSPTTVVLPTASPTAALVPAAVTLTASPAALLPPAAVTLTTSPAALLPPPAPTPTAGMPSKPPYGVAGGDSIGDPYIPELGNTGYDVQSYHLNLDLDPAQETFNANLEIIATVTLENLGRLSLDSLGLDLHRVFVNDQVANFYQNQSKVYIDLPRPFALGERLVIAIDYQGKFLPYSSPYMPGYGLGISRPAPNQLLAFSEPDGARAWFPANDHPLDKAEFRLQASVPQGLTAVSNGNLLQTDTTLGKSTFTWYEDDPIATYLVALSVADYRRIDDRPVGDIQVRHYAFADDENMAQHVQRTSEILQFLTGLIGSYPYDEFGFVEVEPADLGMETQTSILLARNYWQKKDPSEILVHEAAHHWFGNHLSLKSWGETWLNEGFATYIQFLWLVTQNEPLQKLLSDAETDLLSIENKENSALVNPAAGYLFGANPYQKGAWVLHMLRLELGDEAFFALLKQYYQRFAGGYVTTADFQALAEEYRGSSLETFFDQWTESPVLPHLEISWTSTTNATAAQVIVQVCQTQAGAPFEIPLELRFNHGKDQVQSEVVQIAAPQERFTLSLPFNPAKLVSDPDQELLAGIQVERVDTLVPCPNNSPFIDLMRRDSAME